jgi:hypothetical protein
MRCNFNFEQMSAPLPGQLTARIDLFFTSRV